MATAVLTSKGRVTIPEVVRERLGLKQGDRVEFVEARRGEFVVRAAMLDIRRLKGIIPKPKRPVSPEAMKFAARRRAGR